MYKKLIGVDYDIRVIANEFSVTKNNIVSQLKRLKTQNVELRQGPQIGFCATLFYCLGKSYDGAPLVINKAKSTRICIDKIRTFQALKGVCHIPEYTTSLDVALGWDEENVVARTLTKSSGGKGIYFKEDNLEKFIEGKLFTKYIKKKAEYRVHVSLNKAFDVQQKKLKLTNKDGTPVDKSKVDWRVRNSKNGFIFARNNIDVPVSVLKEAEKACKAIGIDIAARPGLEGTTLDNYVKEIQNVCDHLLEA
jgi:hypothetical protein